MLMLFYTILMTALHIIIGLTCIQPIIEKVESSESLIILKLSTIIIGFILNCLIFGAILNFFRFHVGLILDNYTTLQILEMKRQKQEGSQQKSPYDIGNYYNWVQVFGRNWKVWWIPIFLNGQGPSGDGILWPKFNNNEIQE